MQGLEGILDESEDEEEDDNINEARSCGASSFARFAARLQLGGRHGHRGCQKDRKQNKAAQKSKESILDATVHVQSYMMTRKKQQSLDKISSMLGKLGITLCMSAIWNCLGCEKGGRGLISASCS